MAGRSSRGTRRAIPAGSTRYSSGTVLDRLFNLTASGTTIRTELLAGVTTFLTMSYIIFVQPAVLQQAGMDHGAVLTATCLASALATLLMAFLANYPIGVAPAMSAGKNCAITRRDRRRSVSPEWRT